MKIAGVTERLIELVKENSFLYDSNHEDHRSTTRRCATWDNIAQAMEIPDVDGKLVVVFSFMLYCLKWHCN